MPSSRTTRLTPLLLVALIGSLQVAARPAVASGTERPDRAAGPAPTLPPVSRLAPASEITRTFDAILEAGWKQADITPSVPATDAAFLRRLSLDLRGRIPTAEEAADFIASRSTTKRIDTIRSYLASDEHPAYFARLFTEALIGSTDIKREVQPQVLTGWLEEAFRENRPWTGIVTDLITATGLRSENGPVNFLLRYSASPEEAAGAASRLFLGKQIQCAQCHDHPYEDWTQEDFYGMAAFFARTARQTVRDEENPQRRDFAIIDRSRGEALLAADADVFSKPKGADAPESTARPRKTRIAPRFLDGEALTDQRGVTRREMLADLLVAPDNPYLAPALVNRLVAIVFGRGFVDPVDDFSTENPPCQPEALALLADDFVASNYDIRRTLEVLVSSRAYALSSLPSADNAHDDESFSKMATRPLNPDQLFNSILTATGLDRQYEARGDAERQRMERRRAGRSAATDRVTDEAMPESQDESMDSGEDMAASSEDGMAAGEPRLAPRAEAPEPPRYLDPVERLRLRFFQQVRAAQADEEPEEGLQESIPKSLALLNGDIVNTAIRIRGNPRRRGAAAVPATGRTIDAVFFGTGSMSDGDRVETLYLATVSRPPTDAEKKRAIKAVNGAENRRVGLEDLFWALLNSSEFLLNH